MKTLSFIRCDKCKIEAKENEDFETDYKFDGFWFELCATCKNDLSDVIKTWLKRTP